MNHPLYTDFTPAQRGKFSGVAVRAAIKLRTQWSLSDTEFNRLLGRPNKTEHREWIRAANAHETFTLPVPVLNRLTAAIAVFDALKTRYAESGDKMMAWLRKSHSAPVFEGKSPLVRLLDQDVNHALAVRGYVDTMKNQ